MGKQKKGSGGVPKLQKEAEKMKLCDGCGGKEVTGYYGWLPNMHDLCKDCSIIAESAIRKANNMKG